MVLIWGQPHMKQSVAINTDTVTWKCDYDEYRVSNFFLFNCFVGILCSWLWCVAWNLRGKNKVKTCGSGGQEVIMSQSWGKSVSTGVFMITSAALKYFARAKTRVPQIEWRSQRSSFLKKSRFWRKKYIPSCMWGKNRVDVNAKKHFNASLFETTRIIRGWSNGQK